MACSPSKRLCMSSCNSFVKKSGCDQCGSDRADDRPTFRFQTRYMPGRHGSCKRYALSPVTAGSRWHKCHPRDASVSARLPARVVLY
jgi:hypothetical protein